MPLVTATRAKLGPNLLSLSRIRYLGACPYGVASRSCCAVQASVGERVTPTWMTFRVFSSMMKKAKSGRKKRPGIRLSSFWELAGSALRISRPLPFHSHTTCCPSPCLGYYPQQLATMATPSPRGRVDSGRGTIAGPFPSVPLRTVRDRFRVTRLSGSGLAPVQPSHITCASPSKAVHLDCFALRVAFPRSLVGHHSHDYYQSSVAISFSGGRRSRVPSQWYVRATDVGHPLISLLDLIGHRPR